MTTKEHLMVIGMEECHEIAQRISKALRFSLNEIQPDPVANPDRLTNRERIQLEYSDLAAVMEMIGIVAPTSPQMDAKRAKVERFLAYSRACGTLSEGVSAP